MPINLQIVPSTISLLRALGSSLLQSTNIALSNSEQDHQLPQIWNHVLSFQDRGRWVSKRRLTVSDLACVGRR